MGRRLAVSTVFLWLTLGIYEASGAALTEKIPSIITDDGVSYHDVEITRITDQGIAIIHSTGAANIRFSALTKNPNTLPEAARKAVQRFNENSKRRVEAQEQPKTDASARDKPTGPARSSVLKPNLKVVQQIETSGETFTALEQSIGASDSFIVPDFISDGDPSYTETIEFIKAKLESANPTRDSAHYRAIRLGFGEHIHRMILRTAYEVFVFNPADMDTEVTYGSARERFGWGEAVPVKLICRNNLTKIQYVDLAYANSPKAHYSPTLRYSVRIAVGNERDAEKVAKAFSHLIQMFGGSKELF